jgi:hypothetical protein
LAGARVDVRRLTTDFKAQDFSARPRAPRVRGQKHLPYLTVTQLLRLRPKLIIVMFIVPTVASDHAADVAS